ncbi:hypothetical protein SSP24_33390 [Streptomyces spinoverrucosus]|uniref:Uncharacterized protein n=1 Tax=Streptomyces spinoverrucosus TaxID=284043 RepID=A0A4Y3VFL4_9ACTN|nr:DUF6417 family protein [Streptomyces spinoverrucosus]GEC05684.1 hypothetical protein SSP24_33390 [Streptomyces spinoverrucosus]GHB78086.1 hypothetical protein GCM10010397_55900 [Streptomyces spinoverrucosus]
MSNSYGCWPEPAAVAGGLHYRALTAGTAATWWNGVERQGRMGRSKGQYALLEALRTAHRASSHGWATESLGLSRDSVERLVVAETNRWLLHVTDEQVASIAYAFYLEGHWGHVTAANRFGRTYGIIHRPQTSTADSAETTGHSVTYPHIPGNRSRAEPLQGRRATARGLDHLGFTYQGQWLQPSRPRPTDTAVTITGET